MTPDRSLPRILASNARAMARAAILEAPATVGNDVASGREGWREAVRQAGRQETETRASNCTPAVGPNGAVGLGEALLQGAGKVSRGVEALKMLPRADFPQNCSVLLGARRYGDDLREARQSSEAFEHEVECLEPHHHGRSHALGAGGVRLRLAVHPRRRLVVWQLSVIVDRAARYDLTARVDYHGRERLGAEVESCSDMRNDVMRFRESSVQHAHALQFLSIAVALEAGRKPRKRGPHCNSCLLRLHWKQDANRGRGARLGKAPSGGFVSR